MSSSPPNKLFEGQTGFPTPNAPPEDTGCRVFVIPSDEEWFALFMAAALKLTYEYNWFTNGDLTPAEAASSWSDIIDAAYQRSLLGTCLLEVPAPYWDEGSADDADDEMPPDTQIWYGEIVALPAFVAEDAELTFLDNIGIWAIAGFIAYAGQPGAAIAFVPLAQKFVLAFKQHSLGGVVSVLVDFLHLADIDTYGVEDGIVNYTVSIPDDGESHTLYVQMSEDHNSAVTDPPNIQVIRKRLDTTEVTPQNIRYNIDCDCVQQSPDDGATWVDSPTQDPRSSTIFQVPPRTGGDPKCDSAQQMHDRIKNMLDAIITSSDILQAINSFVAVIAVFFFEVGFIIEAIWAIVSAIFSIGTTTLNAALTDAVYDQLLCIFWCHISADGSCTEDQYNAIVDDINTNIGGIAATALVQALASIGWVGLSNAGALGEVTGDCSACACGWCRFVDLTMDCPSDFNLFRGNCDGGNGVTGIFIDSNNKSDVYAEITLGATYRFTHISMTFSASFGGSNGSAVIQGYLAGVQVFSSVSAGDGTHVTFSWDGDEMIDYFNVQCNSGTDATPAHLEQVQIEGLGSAPAILGDC